MVERSIRSGLLSGSSVAVSPVSSSATLAGLGHHNHGHHGHHGHHHHHHHHHSGSGSTGSDSDRRPLAICVRNLPLRSSDTSLKDGLFHEYKKHGKVVTVKVAGQGTERVAIVRFKKAEDVEKALEVSRDKLFFGCKIQVRPSHFVLLGFTRLYWFILGYTGFHRVLLGFHGFHQVLQGLTGFS